MALYADQLPRVSLAQLRAQFKPRRFKTITSVTLQIDGMATEVKIVTAPGDGCVGVARQWIECHTCKRRVNTVGWVLGFAWSCRRCLGWRARNRARGPIPACAHE